MNNAILSNAKLRQHLGWSRLKSEGWKALRSEGDYHLCGSSELKYILLSTFSGEIFEIDYGTAYGLKYSKDRLEFSSLVTPILLSKSKGNTHVDVLRASDFASPAYKAVMGCTEVDEELEKVKKYNTFLKHKVDTTQAQLESVKKDFKDFKGSVELRDKKEDVGILGKWKKFVIGHVIFLQLYAIGAILLLMEGAVSLSALYWAWFCILTLTSLIKSYEGIRDKHIIDVY